jgi:hypothetical protein
MIRELRKRLSGRLMFFVVTALLSAVAIMTFKRKPVENKDAENQDA